MNIAIELKRNHKLSTPDSIICATSIFEKIPLLTADKEVLNVSKLDTITFSV